MPSAGAVELFIDPDDARGLVAQLYDQLRGAISDGRLRPGDRLTSTRRAAAELGVSRSTVADAYYRLAAEGYIEGRAGGGSVVCAVPVAAPTPRMLPVEMAVVPAAAAVRPYSQRVDHPVAFDFRPGSLDPALFPTAEWRRSMLRALDDSTVSYGDPAGSLRLREALAGWITRSRGVAATAEEVFVTSGAGHAVDLIARALLSPGSLVAVEDPGYPPVVELLRSHRMQVVGVPVDEEGILVEAIPRRARLVYVTPSHQFPLGMPMSRRRRLQLLRWASRASCPIIEDDYDSEFRHTARPLEPLQRLDTEGWVIYVGTFSKSLSPDLRIGFMVAPLALMPTLRAIRQVIDWCPPHTSQSALATMILDGHLDRHLRRCRGVYTQRRRMLWDGLGALLPPGYRPLPAVAGLHVAVVAPSPMDDDLIATQPDLLVSRLNRCYLRVAPDADGLLLGFAGIATAELPKAIRTLASALIQGSPRSPGVVS